MKPSAAQITEAVRYIQNRDTGAAYELDALVQKIERYMRNTCTVVKLHMLPEIAEALQVEVGGFDFVLLGDIDDALCDLGPVYTMPQLVEIVILNKYWAIKSPIKTAAMYDAHGSDLCFFAVQQEFELDDMIVFTKHFKVSEHMLKELKKLPIKMGDVASLLEDGVPVEKVVSITNDLRRNGLRGLIDRVRASAQGYPKPLLDGVI
jgi:hypothetical protein